MDARNCEWYSKRMEQPRVAIFDQWTAQLAELERKICAIGNQSVQNTNYYHQQPINTQNYYHPSWQDYPNYSWNSQDQFFAPSYYHHDFQYSPPQQQVHKSKLEERLERFLEGTAMKTNNQEVFAPELSYPQDIQYQPPPQEEKQSNLEIITKLIERNEVSMTNQEESLRNIGNYLEQIANVINNWPQDTLPSNTEIDSKEESKELCESDTFESGKVFQEAVKRNLKRLYPDVEEDCEIEHKRRKLWEEEKNVDDQALSLSGVKQISPMSVVQNFQNSEEYVRVDLGEGKIKNLDEYKFGGGFQFFMDAMEIKEKTKRRHEKIIFAIEPD